MTKYNHTEEMHNMQSPLILIPYFLELGDIKSVVDIGCGLGTFLRAFKEKGINDIIGIDGKWCKKELLFKNIEPVNFIEKDLEEEIKLERKFDLAISLEVAEHLSPQRADSFVKDLCNLSDNIIFSAALPYQGGDNHLNEKPLSYWIKIFEKNGFDCFDTIRPKIWGDDRIFWWYRQNIVFFKRRSGKSISQLSPIIDVVHPELLKTVVDFKDKNATKRHLKLLLKSILFKLNGSKN